MVNNKYNIYIPYLTDGVGRSHRVYNNISANNAYNGFQNKGLLLGVDLRGQQCLLFTWRRPHEPDHRALQAT